MTGTAVARAPLGLLHTVPALAATFTDLLAERAPGAPLVHVVDAGLLHAAIAGGVTPEVVQRVGRHVDHLVAAGAAAVLVTCSSIGEAAEAAAVRRAAPGADVVVLAQASMAAAADDARVSVPVLTSPAGGADALVAACTDRADWGRRACPNRVVVSG